VQKERHHVVDLAEAFDAWLEPFDKNDALRVVAGGPGSGKSSFVKWWAAQVMQREPMIPTLLVPLHYLKTLDLEREVGDYAKLCGFPANPLDTDEPASGASSSSSTASTSWTRTRSAAATPPRPW
jgi:hypothetical protein